MAKKAYIGVNGVARKIKKGYIGVNTLARKIKKVYIGVGGVARPCWSGGELVYWGVIDKGVIVGNSSGRCMHGAETIGDYAIFAGGEIPSGQTNNTTIYNSSLTKTSATFLGEARYNIGTATTNNHAIFYTGYTNKSSTMGTYSVDAYDSALTHSYPTQSNSRLHETAGASINGYALFAGGRGGSTAARIVYSYDSSLTYMGRDSLTETATLLAATTVEGYALFGGGLRSVSAGVSANVWAYNGSITRSEPTALSLARYELAATTVGDYALFAGGMDDNNTTTGQTVGTVDAYNASLTRITATSLSVPRYSLAATSLGEYAIFAGGFRNGATGSQNVGYLALVDVYDTSLTRTTSTNLGVGRSYLAATSVGKYALFAGGDDGTSLRNDDIDVYTIAS